MTVPRLLFPLSLVLLLCAVLTSRPRPVTSQLELEAPHSEPLPAVAFEYVVSHGAVLLRVDAEVRDPSSVMLIADHGDEMDILPVLPGGQPRGDLGFAGTRDLLQDETTWYLMDGTDRIQLPAPQQRLLV
jgi:hypothetical protein